MFGLGHHQVQRRDVVCDATHYILTEDGVWTRCGRAEQEPYLKKLMQYIKADLYFWGDAAPPPRQLGENYLLLGDQVRGCLDFWQNWDSQHVCHHVGHMYSHKLKVNWPLHITEHYRRLQPFTPVLIHKCGCGYANIRIRAHLKYEVY